MNPKKMFFFLQYKEHIENLIVKFVRYFLVYFYLVLRARCSKYLFCSRYSHLSQSLHSSEL